MALPIRRPMGNAQSRNTALGRAPQYGATSNPNGAQTASRMTPGGMPVVAPAPAVIPQQTPAVAYEANPAPAPYAGGNVPGVAQYYRNSALQSYRSPANSAQQSGIARSVQSANPDADMRSPNYSPLNGYDGFTAAYNDPNRLRPDQKFEVAQQGARNYDAYDPTNQGGNRFAAGAARIQANQAYDQAAIAAGTQAENQRMQGVASDSQQRAMDANSENRQFAYKNAQGEMVSTNRLGQLQQMAQADPTNADIKIAIAQERQRTSALGANQEAQRERRRAASSDGLTDKERRRLGNKTRDANRAVRAGVISSEERDARITRNTQLAREQSDFRASETKLRRSGLNATNEADMMDAIRSDRTRDANGQLNVPVREAASTVLSRLADPTYKPTTPRVQEQQRHVIAYGLTPWSEAAGGDSPSTVSEKVLSKGISNYKQAEALHRYWNAQKDSDNAWLEADSMNPQIALLDEMAAVPKEELSDWFEKNKGRLLGLRGQYENPEGRGNPDNGFLRDNMPYQMMN